LPTNSYRSSQGVSLAQDGRFADKTQKFMKRLKFPPEIDRRVDLSKVQMQLIHPWITKRITELLHLEDEVVVNYVTTLLEDKVRNLQSFLFDYFQTFKTLRKLQTKEKINPNNFKQFSSGSTRKFKFITYKNISNVI
jgi:hypothetical protein